MGAFMVCNRLLIYWQLLSQVTFVHAEEEDACVPYNPRQCLFCKRPQSCAGCSYNLYTQTLHYLCLAHWLSLPPS